jgi:hypothetical protein
MQFMEQVSSLLTRLDLMYLRMRVNFKAHISPEVAAIKQVISSVDLNRPLTNLNHNSPEREKNMDEKRAEILNTIMPPQI